MAIDEDGVIGAHIEITHRAAFAKGAGGNADGQHVVGLKDPREMAGAANEAHRLGPLGGADQIPRLEGFDRPLAAGGGDQGAGKEASNNRRKSRWETGLWIDPWKGEGVRLIWRVRWGIGIFRVLFPFININNLSR